MQARRCANAAIRSSLVSPAGAVAAATPTAAGAQTQPTELWLHANDTTAGHDAHWAPFVWSGSPSYAPGVPAQLSAFAVDGTNGLVAPDAALGNAGIGDLVVQFDRNTSPTGAPSARVAKRPDCGSPPFWDLRLDDGNLHGELDVVDGVQTLANPVPIDDGRWHTVNLTRQRTTVTLAIDGPVVASSTVAETTQVDNDAPVTVADEDPCIGVDGTVPHVGLPSADARGAALVATALGLLAAPRARRSWRRHAAP